jgi:hypothetical protein
MRDELLIMMLKRNGVLEYKRTLMSVSIKFKESDNPHVSPQELVQPSPSNYAELMAKAQQMATENVSDEDILRDPYMGLPPLGKKG